MKKKYYAVRIGRTPGVYQTWEECQKNVTNYEGAEYKSFKDINDAFAYLLSNDKDNYYDRLIIDLLKKNYTVIFTDGSFEESLNKASWAAIVLTKEKEKHLSGIIENSDLLKSRNIVGEVFAVLKSLEYSLSNNIKKVAIIHDYEGLKYWATKEWRAKEDISKFYVEELTKYKDIEIVFYWVKGHSQVKYNEKVDRLAAEALKK